MATFERMYFVDDPYRSPMSQAMQCLLEVTASLRNVSISLVISYFTFQLCLMIQINF